MPPSFLQEVSTNLVPYKVTSPGEGGHEIDKTKLMGAIDIVEVADDIHADVAPQQEAPHVEI